MDALRLLVVDDNKDAASTLALLLAEVGHQVLEVYGGESVLGLVLEFRPDAVLLDLAMPKVSGYDVARELKEFFRDECPALIAVTALGQSADKILGKIIGFDHYLTKPCDFGELLTALGEVAAKTVSPPPLPSTESGAPGRR